MGEKTDGLHASEECKGLQELRTIADRFRGTKVQTGLPDIQTWLDDEERNSEYGHKGHPQRGAECHVAFLGQRFRGSRVGVQGKIKVVGAADEGQDWVQAKKQQKAPCLGPQGPLTAQPAACHREPSSAGAGWGHPLQDEGLGL